MFWMCVTQMTKTGKNETEIDTDTKTEHFRSLVQTLETHMFRMCVTQKTKTGEENETCLLHQQRERHMCVCQLK